MTLVLTLGASHASLAQGIPGLENLIPVQVQPTVLTLSDATPTAALTVSNLTGAALDVWLALDCEQPDSLIVHADPLEASWQNRSACAAAWLTGVPHHLVLDPQANVTVPITVAPYPTLPDGHYTARLIYAQTPFHAGGGVGVMHNTMTIVYDKGPVSARPSRARWAATPISAAVAVSHIPDVVVLDDHTRAATVTLRNPAATPTEVWLALDCPWFQVHMHPVQGTLSSQVEQGWHQVSPTAVLWVSDYPQHVVLAPHEQRTIPVQVIPYPGLGIEAGSYYARVVYVQSPVLTVTGTGDTTFTTPQGAIPLVYHHGAVGALTLTQLHVVSQPDGTRQACVTVQQPGIGVVATLHAGVSDAHGHPIPHLGATATDRSSPWGLDTTVAVWLPGQHPLTSDPGDDPPQAGEPPDPIEPTQRPVPICLPLPTLASGHYQVAVSAAPFEDQASHQVVHATLALTVP